MLSEFILKIIVCVINIIGLKLYMHKNDIIQFIGSALISLSICYIIDFNEINVSLT